MLEPVTLRVGLVGAGPWADMFHAPMLAAGPQTSLAAVWARRPEAAEQLASSYDAQHTTSFDDLLDACDAVAFAVPPPVQALLAPRAAQAGKHLLLEKPLAFTLEEAEGIAAAVDAAGVQSLLVLRNRFTAEGRAFVANARAGGAIGAMARFVSGAALAGQPVRHAVAGGAGCDVRPGSARDRPARRRARTGHRPSRQPATRCAGWV